MCVQAKVISALLSLLEYSDMVCLFNVLIYTKHLMEGFTQIFENLTP